MAEGTGGEIGAITVKGVRVGIWIITVEGTITIIIAAGAGIMIVITVATVLMEASLTLVTNPPFFFYRVRVNL